MDAKSRILVWVPFESDNRLGKHCKADSASADKLHWPALLYPELDTCLKDIQQSIPSQDAEAVEHELSMAAMEFTIKTDLPNLSMSSPEQTPQVARLLGFQTELAMVKDDHDYVNYYAGTTRFIPKQRHRRELFASEDDFICFHRALDEAYAFMQAKTARRDAHEVTVSASHMRRPGHFERICLIFLGNHSRANAQLTATANPSNTVQPTQTEPQDPTSGVAVSVSGESAGSADGEVTADRNSAPATSTPPRSPQTVLPQLTTPLRDSEDFGAVLRKLTFAGMTSHQVRTQDAATTEFMYVLPSATAKPFDPMNGEQLQQFCRKQLQWNGPLFNTVAARRSAPADLSQESESASSSDSENDTQIHETREDADMSVGQNDGANHEDELDDENQVSDEPSSADEDEDERAHHVTSPKSTRAPKAKRTLIPSSPADSQSVASAATQGSRQSSRHIKSPRKLGYRHSTGIKRRPKQKTETDIEHEFYRLSHLWHQILKPVLGWAFISSGSLRRHVRCAMTKTQLEFHNYVYGRPETIAALGQAAQDKTIKLKMVHGVDFFIQAEDVMNYCKARDYFGVYGSAIREEFATLQATESKRTVPKKKKNKKKKLETPPSTPPRAAHHSSPDETTSDGSDFDHDESQNESALVMSPASSSGTVTSIESEGAYYLPCNVRNRIEKNGWKVMKGLSALDNWWYIPPQHAHLGASSMQKMKLERNKDYFATVDELVDFLQKQDAQDADLQRRFTKAKAAKDEEAKVPAKQDDPTQSERHNRTKKRKHHEYHESNPNDGDTELESDGMRTSETSNSRPQKRATTSTKKRKDAPWAEYMLDLHYAPKHELACSPGTGVQYSNGWYYCDGESRLQYTKRFSSPTEVFQHFLHNGMPNTEHLSADDRYILDLLVRHSNLPDGTNLAQRQQAPLLSSTEAWDLLQRYGFQRQQDGSIHAPPNSKLACTQFGNLQQLRRELRGVANFDIICPSASASSAGRRSRSASSKNRVVSDDELLALKLWCATSSAPLLVRGQSESGAVDADDDDAVNEDSESTEQSQHVTDTASSCVFDVEEVAVDGSNAKPEQSNLPDSDGGSDRAPQTQVPTQVNFDHPLIDLN